MKRRLKIYIMLIAVLAAAFILIGTSMQDTMVYYVTVAELISGEKNFEGRGVRVNGTVVAGSLMKHDATSYEFTILADDATMQVRYHGILPDTFRDDHEVLLEGQYIGAGTFEARQIFTKCASKYEAAPESAETQQEKSQCPN